ncbi:hypothetical protein D0809_26035 [Flavobacterium circumlabens]|uniref:Uncharacterized protein n=1 Tax=Flavobacterium circumlabens TaxID=2133765 RepID=A0A4Y7U5I1_9FLAO|nr:hypothetical protein D0809_26035 [Flavobacterium circumlabens]
MQIIPNSGLGVWDFFNLGHCSAGYFHALFFMLTFAGNVSTIQFLNKLLFVILGTDKIKTFQY